MKTRIVNVWNLDSRQSKFAFLFENESQTKGFEKKYD
jgi:hypothetical protein